MAEQNYPSNDKLAYTWSAMWEFERTRYRYLWALLSALKWWEGKEGGFNHMSRTRREQNSWDALFEAELYVDEGEELFTKLYFSEDFVKWRDTL